VSINHVGGVMKRLTVFGCLLFFVSSFAFSSPEIFFPELDPTKEIPQKPIREETLKDFDVTNKQSKQIKQLSSILSYMYDEQGNVVLNFLDFFDNVEKKVDRYKWRYTYDDKFFLLSYTTNLNKEISESATCFYDSNKRLASVIYRNKSNAQFSKDVFKYNSDGILIEVLSSFVNENLITFKYLYNRYGNIEESTIYDSNDNITNKSTYFYKDGVLLKSIIENYLIFRGENSLYSKKTFEYYTNGRVKKENSEDGGVGNSDSRINEYFYKYKDNFIGDWIEKSKYKYYTNGLTEKLVLSRITTRDIKYW
jgi:hypothetical protein